MNVTAQIIISGLSLPERFSISASGSGSAEIRETIAPSTTDDTLNLNYDPTTTEFLYINSDQALTLKTYDSGDTLVDTVTLGANNPILYRRSPLFGAVPFTDPFAYLTVTNGSSVNAANLTVLKLEDATP